VLITKDIYRSLNELGILSRITGVSKKECQDLFCKTILKYNKIHLTIALYQVLDKSDLMEEALRNNMKAFE
jgi:hypothetical protein